jgi:hypothetical protein
MFFTGSHSAHTLRLFPVSLGSCGAVLIKSIERFPEEVEAEHWRRRFGECHGAAAGRRPSALLYTPWTDFPSLAPRLSRNGNLGSSKAWDEIPPGERPDTLLLKKVPELMFRSTPKSRQPDAEAVTAALECFGAVEEVEVLPNNQSAGAAET